MNTHDLSACNQEAQQTAHGQARNKHQAHETTRRFTLMWSDIGWRAHHARATEPAIGEAKAELDYQKVKQIALDDGAFAVQVACEIERDEGETQKREGEEESRTVRQV